MSETRSCPHCSLTVGSSDRFCTHCGARLVVSIESPRKDEALYHLASSIGLALQRGDPTKVISLVKAALVGTLEPGYAAIAYLVAMSAEAQLNHPGDALRSAVRARESYSELLGLAPSQKEAYVTSGLFIDDLLETGRRAVRDNPWLWYLLGHYCGPKLPAASKAGESLNLQEYCKGWAEFLVDHREATLRALAQVLLAASCPSEAAGNLSNLILMARRYEYSYPPRIEVIWPRVVLGECYSTLGQLDKAVGLWRSASLAGVCFEGDPDDLENAGIPWIERANDNLSRHKCSCPDPSVSMQASHHLVCAVEHLLEAEKWEDRDAAIDQQLDAIRSAESQYSAVLAMASEEIKRLEQLDQFVWAKVFTGEGTSWFRLETLKALLLQKKGLAFLSKERTAAAMACYKESCLLWPTLDGYLTLGGVQFVCGLRLDAKISYETLLRHAEYICSTDQPEDIPQCLIDARSMLRELG